MQKLLRVLAKGYLPISLITPYKLQEIINLVKKTLIKSNPDYDMCKFLYDVKDYIYTAGSPSIVEHHRRQKLVTFRIDQERNSPCLIIQFPTELWDFLAWCNWSSIHSNQANLVSTG